MRTINLTLTSFQVIQMLQCLESQQRANEQTAVKYPELAERFERDNEEIEQIITILRPHLR